jgi:hypothetical protein
MMALILILATGTAAAVALIATVRCREAQAWRASLVCYRLGLPRDVAPDDVTAWLSHVVAATHAPGLGLTHASPVALEVTATAGGIGHVLLVAPDMQGAVLSGLRAALPSIRLEEAPDYLANRPSLGMAAEGRLTSLVRPLAHERSERAAAALLAALQPLRADEAVVVQWVFVGATTPVPVPGKGARDVLRAVVAGEDPTTDAEVLRAARLKQQEPLLRAVVRVGVAAGDRARLYAVFGWVWGTLRGLNAPGVRLVRRWLPESVAASRVMRLALPIVAWPLILNTRELTGLLGLPLGEVALPGLSRGAARQLPPPLSLPTRGSLVALSTYPGMTERELALSTSDRLRHLWVIGPTGVGKSTLLSGLIAQDMAAGRGVVVIDPKGGDLVREVLDRVPEERRDDLVLIDPSETARPVGLNLLDLAGGEHAEELAVDHLVHLMASLWRSSWGPRTSDVLRQALLTLTHTRATGGERFTLVELPELLLNAGFRAFVTRQPAVPEAVRPFWAAYEAMSDGERAQVIGPSLNKLRSFTTRTALRLMLGQSSGVRLDEVFTKRRIILVSLPKGVIGTETAALVGSLVMAGLWQATLARAAVAADRRHPVFVYLDEFQDFLRLPLDLADMLAQSRGLGVGLVLAHQYLGQLSDEVKTAILGTARTQVTFQVEYDDARVLAQRFGPLTQHDLSSLAAYEIAMRPCVNGATLGPVTGRTLPPTAPTTDGATLAADSQQRFGVDRAEVEAALRRRISGGPQTRPTGRQTTGSSADADADVARPLGGV